MTTIAIIAALLIVAPAGMLAGALIERRRNRIAWEQATDQAVQLTHTIRDLEQETWAEVARTLHPTNEYEGYNR